MTFLLAKATDSPFRLLKVSAVTAMWLSAVAAGVVFSAGKAVASTTTCTLLPMALTPFPVNPAGQTCTTTDPALSPSVYSNTAKVVSIPGFPSGTLISLEGTGLNYPISQQQIDTDFNVPGTNNYTGSAITSIYSVVASNFIDGIDLTASGVGAFTVKKEVYSDATLLNKIAELNLTGSGFVPVVSFAPRVNIWIKDTFDNPVPGASSIDNAQNTLRNVPGPLPILGAGAAFGFSRKLRRRIKASRVV